MRTFLKQNEGLQIFVFALGLSLLLKLVLTLILFCAYGGHASFYQLMVQAYERWDSCFYLSIAQYGYLGPYVHHPFQLVTIDNHQHVVYVSALVFFPGYSFVIRWVHLLMHLGYMSSAILVAQISCALALCFLGLLVRREFNFHVAKFSMLTLVLFPTSYYLLSMYTESLFLSLAFASVYAASCRRFYLSSLLVLAASLTRNTGILFEMFLIAYYFHYYGFEFKFWRASWWRRHYQIFSFLIVPCGFFAYMMWLQIHFGDALLFVHVEHSQWHRSFLPIWDTYVLGFHALFSGSDNNLLANGLGFFVLNWLLLALIFGVRYFKISLVLACWWLYLLVMIWIGATAPAPDDILFSLSRFALMMFPAFVYWVLLLKQRWLMMSWLVVSFYLLCICSWFFYDGGWVA